jgi:O-antigen/teichoic acid export membrane protein
MIILAPWAGPHVFHSHQLIAYLQIFGVALPALALNYVFSGVLRALKRTKSALSIERLTMYALGIVAVVTLGQIYGMKAAAIGFVAAIYLSTMEGAVYIARGLPTRKSIIPFSKKQMLVTSAPLLFMVFATYLNGQASVLLLGAFASNSEVGIFNIALKVSMLMNLILQAISVIAATQFAELYASGETKKLQMIISKVSALGALAGLPIFLVLALAAPFWLSLFGHDFTAGAAALVVLTAGQFVNVVLGSSNFVLAMTGHERALAIAVGVSLIFNLACGFILIPPLGVLGAGITTAATITLASIIMTILVKRYLDVWQLPFHYLGVWLAKLRVNQA